MQPGAPNLSMGVIFCGNHTLKCCLSAIRKFVQFRSSTSVRVLFTSNMCWHGRSMWMSRVRQCTVLTGVPATSREEVLLLTTLLYASFRTWTFPSRRPTNLSVNSGANKTKWKRLPRTRRSILYVTDKEPSKSLPLLLPGISILQEVL